MRNQFIILQVFPVFKQFSLPHTRACGFLFPGALLVKLASSDEAERRRRTLCAQCRSFLQKADGLVRKLFLGDGRAAPPYFVYGKRPLISHVGTHPGLVKMMSSDKAER